MKIYTDEEITKKLNRKNKIKKIINMIIYPIIILILICNIFLVLQTMNNPEETPNLFGYKAFNVVSGSMEPNLTIGDIVIIKETKQENIKNGDIITFKEEEHVVTHRVVNVIKENGISCYQTKGDNNNANDEKLVKYEEIEGKYVAKIPKLGEALNYAKTTTGIVIIVLIIYLIYKISQMKDDRKIARHEKRKELEKK